MSVIGTLFQTILNRVRAISHGVHEIIENVKYDVAVKIEPFDPDRFRQKMDERAAEYQSLEGQRLDWDGSLVDLLKAIGIDSSIATRKELANEFSLFDHGKDYEGKGDQNNVLHARLLDALAENDARLPRLRDEGGRPASASSLQRG